MLNQKFKKHLSSLCIWNNSFNYTFQSKFEQGGFLVFIKIKASVLANDKIYIFEKNISFVNMWVTNQDTIRRIDDIHIMNRPIIIPFDVFQNEYVESSSVVNYELQNNIDSIKNIIISKNAELKIPNWYNTDRDGCRLIELHLLVILDDSDTCTFFGLKPSGRHNESVEYHFPTSW